jgi:phosphoribosylglycinamide formyltransferase-1
MLKIGILGSTRGSAMQPIIAAQESNQLKAELVVVISNQEDALILDKARQHHIPACFLDQAKLKRADYDALLSNKLKEYAVDYVVLIGYMRILSEPFIAAWRHKVMNVHPSLLPAFANKMDRAVHQAVLEAGVRETGCTVHEVTERVDEGPIILQKKCPVFDNDTIDTLKARVQSLEGQALIEAIQIMALTKRDVTHAACHH